MPGKSRYSKGKRLSRSKKEKRRQRFSATVARQQVAAQVQKPAAPSVKEPTPIPTLTAARYPYVVTELRTIGILAGIMLATLVVLALVLH